MMYCRNTSRGSAIGVFSRLLAVGMLMATFNTYSQEDPHWRADACASCHLEKPKKGRLNIKGKDMNDLCNSCHKTSESHSIIHPFGMTPSTQMISRMPREFRSAIRRSSGKVSCITCHDLTQTCRSDRNEKRRANPLFFRGGNYQRDPARLCFHCHDEKRYQRLNPHKQTTASGKLKQESCHVCHETVPEKENSPGIEGLVFNIKDNLSELCTGCHVWKPHPGGAFLMSGHLVKPSKTVKRRMEKSQEQQAVHLPLDPGNGKVFCSTCHNVHDKGVIKRIVAAKGAGSKKLLRNQEMCDYCHEK